MCSLKGSVALSSVSQPDVQFPPQSGSFRVAQRAPDEASSAHQLEGRAHAVERARQWERTRGVEAVRSDSIQEMLRMERSNRG